MQNDAWTPNNIANGAIIFIAFTSAASLILSYKTEALPFVIMSYMIAFLITQITAIMRSYLDYKMQLYTNENMTHDELMVRAMVLYKWLEKNHERKNKSFSYFLSLYDGFPHEITKTVIFIDLQENSNDDDAAREIKKKLRDVLSPRKE